MPVLNRIAALSPQMTEWRRALHRQPELGFDCVRTAAFVRQRLEEFGVDHIEDGIAKTGLVAIIEGQAEGPTLGLRADMDALPITEATGAPHASEVPGRMHACGHDGHTAMLLGAGQYLAETRRFAGRVALIFQPAEEQGGGAGVMCEAGMLERYDIDQIYAMHTVPRLPVGHFATTGGPFMAAVDAFHIHIEGRGGHGAMPHETADPIPAALSIAQAIQTIVSRNHDAGDELVVSVTQIHAGTTDNVIPDTAYICGTVRTFDPAVQEMVQNRLAQIVDGQAASFDVAAQLDYVCDYPALVNDAEKAAFAAEVAADVVGADKVDAAAAASMGAEDFAYFLNRRPGAYVLIGQGPAASLHHPAYDFNDAILPIGASFFARLPETAMPLKAA